MNKVLMTGLAVGTDVGVCDVCNYDFEWLLRYPSIFLWADQILLTKTIYDQIVKAHIVGTEEKALPQSIKLVFELAKSEGIIETVEPTKVITPDVRNAIWEEVAKDREVLQRFYPNDVRINEQSGVPMEIFVNDIPYCGPHVATIYSTLALTKAWDANCFFSDSVLNYLVYKFGISGMPRQSEPGKAEAFTSVFNAYLPNINFFPEYALQSHYDAEKCAACSRIQNCKDTYLPDLEKEFRKILTWRNYDEILQLKEVVDKIINKRNKSNGIIDPDSVLQEFQSVESKYRRRIKKIFPKVKRWANITTSLSIPMALVGLAADQPLITVAGTVLSGVSKLAEETINYLTSKMSWVSFTAKEEEFTALKVED